MPIRSLADEQAAARALSAALGAAVDPAAVRDHLRRAGQAIGARLVLACARERLVDFELQDMSLKTCSFDLPLRRRRAFELHAADEADCDLPALPALLHALLGDRVPRDDLARVAAELEDSASNLALARLAAELRDRACSEGQPWPAPLDPENLVVDGHPWHPMCKTRLGLSLDENLAHGPDLLARAPVCAVDVAAARCQLAGDFAALVRELFPAPAPGWVRLPVHALQRARLPALAPDLWGSHIRPVDLPPRPARALLSLRTVALADLHLKLAVDVHTTSARRTVSPHSVHNGPRLAALLADIQARDPDARRGLRIQPDLAAAGLHPDHGPVAAQLGVIVRPDPAPLAAELARADPGMHAPGLHAPAPALVVCAALGNRRPGGDLLLRELSAGYPGDRRARLAAFFADYVDLLVPPLLRFWTAHGVALEAHLQNTLLVHAGRPRGFVVRDLGGVRLHRGRLAAAGHAPDLAPGSFVVTGDLAEAQGKLMHTLVHAHLAALIGWIDDAGGPEPEFLWPRVRAAIERCHGAWATRPDLARACAEDRAFFFAPICRAKALLRMRIELRVSDYAYTEVANALAAGYPAGAA